MKAFLAFIMAVLLASPALAQTPSRLDAAAIRQAAAAAVAPASTSPQTNQPMSRRARVITGAVFGAGAGMLGGWALWNVFRDCGTCGPGPTEAVVSTGVLGAGIGAYIGLLTSASPQRHPGIRISRHMSADVVVTPSRRAGVVKVTF